MGLQCDSTAKFRGTTYCLASVNGGSLALPDLQNQIPSPTTISYGNQLIYLTAQKFQDENSTSGYCLGYLSTFMWQSRYVQHACQQRTEMAEAGKSMSPEGATPDRADR